MLRIIARSFIYVSLPVSFFLLLSVFAMGVLIFFLTYINIPYLSRAVKRFYHILFSLGVFNKNAPQSQTTFEALFPRLREPLIIIIGNIEHT